MTNENIIFDLTNKNCKYKGVLFADFDPPEFRCFTTEGNPAGLILLIWTDENDEWHVKSRIKFKSGNKIAFERDFEKNLTVEQILEELYSSLPLSNKKWVKNESETATEIIEIMQREDMIEYVRIEKK